MVVNDDIMNNALKHMHISPIYRENIQKALDQLIKPMHEVILQISLNKKWSQVLYQ